MKYVAIAAAILIAGQMSAKALDYYTYSSAVAECRKLFVTKEDFAKLVTRVEALGQSR